MVPPGQGAGPSEGEGQKKPGGQAAHALLPVSAYVPSAQGKQMTLTGAYV